MKKILSSKQLRRKYWIEERSVPEISKSTGIPIQSLYDLMRNYGIPRRGFTESNYLVFKTKPQFQLKTLFEDKDEKLKIAGIMLYWAEGAQTGTVVDFTNSKPEMIQVFLKFLREICGISESRLRLYLYYHGTMEEAEVAKQFWHRITDIPLEQFSRPYLPKKTGKQSCRVMPHGLVHIRYSDKRLLQFIQSWIKEYIQKELRAGTQVANGARL